MSMGGQKKRSVSSSEKSAQTDNKPKKEETKQSGKPQQKHKISVLIDESAGLKSLQTMKAITTNSLARSLGVKISVANNFIKTLESKGQIRLVGGYSGHKVYEYIKQ